LHIQVPEQAHVATERGLVAYAYDPSTDDDIEDDMHDAREWKEGGSVSWRGVINVTTLVALIAALLCLFIVYPVYRVFTDNGVNEMIMRNTRINATHADLDPRGMWGVDCEQPNTITTPTPSTAIARGWSVHIMCTISPSFCWQPLIVITDVLIPYS
jgi:hypothetical protein